jgi:putative sigma-54 modulation protein
MELQIIARNDVTVSPAIEEYANTRISKMARYLPSIDGGKVEISREGARQPDQRFVVQATLNSNGMVIRAQERADDIRTAVDRVVDASPTGSPVQGQAFREGQGHGPHHGTSSGGRRGRYTGRIVKTKQFAVKPIAG